MPSRRIPQRQSPVRAEPVEARIAANAQLQRHSRGSGNPHDPTTKTKAAILTLGVTTFLVLLACAPTPAQVNNSGNDLFESAQTEETPEAASGAYQEALGAYEEAQQSEPEKAEPYYNAGNALYRMEDYEGAHNEYDDALLYAEGDLRAQGLFNKGNVYFTEEQYPEAIEAYKEVLRIQPENDDAKHNLELAMSKLPQEDQGEEPEENDEEGPQQQQEQQEDQQEQQDEQNEQDQQEQESEEEQQDEQQDQQQNNEQDDQQQEQAQQQQQPQTEPITPEQARQLLETFESQTLQERLQQVLVSPEPPPQNPW